MLTDSESPEWMLVWFSRLPRSPKLTENLADTHVIRMVCFPLNLREWATVIPEPGAKDFFKHILIHVLQPC